MESSESGRGIECYKNCGDDWKIPAKLYFDPWIEHNLRSVSKAKLSLVPLYRLKKKTKKD
jgi:hypothetical protein